VQQQAVNQEDAEAAERENLKKSRTLSSSTNFFLTIHSIRTRFTGRLNSGVGRHHRDASHMAIEYKIKFNVPGNFKPSAPRKKFPSPIERGQMTEIFNYALNPMGSILLTIW